MVDRYTKVVLTVIAVALSVISFRMVVTPEPALAQLGGAGCGDSRLYACYVRITGEPSVYVTNMR